MLVLDLKLLLFVARWCSPYKPARLDTEFGGYTRMTAYYDKLTSDYLDIKSFGHLSEFEDA